MRWTIERLRLAIIVAAAVLLGSIAGSIFYGRWRLREVAQDLPARLGIQIQQTTQGFVLSKTEQGRKVFTLHAARSVAFKTGGRVLLHDVEIDMYHRQDNNADTIAGKDFEYDRDSQIVTAQGEANIVLHVPQSDVRLGAANKQGPQIVYVTTHGLVFNQKTGAATCSGEVDFQFSNSSGQAMGAEYDSKQGHLLLRSQVVLTTQMQDRPAVVRASQATYDRDESQVHLLLPRYSSRTPRGNEQGSAGTATVYLRGDGSAERLDAQNAVELASADGTDVRSAVMTVHLNEKNQPRQAHFLGGVQFTQNQPTQQTAGGGRQAVVDFDSAGHANRVTIDGEVKFQQQIDRDKDHLHRTLAANHLVLHLRPSPSGQAQLETADATGNAAFASQSMTRGHPSQATSLAAQTLKAKFLAGNELQHLDGIVDTRMRMVEANGDIDTSTGDALSVDFVTGTPQSPIPKAAKPPVQRRASATSIANPANGVEAGAGEGLTAQSIRTAVQTGHVVLQQMSTNGTGGAGVAPGSQISTATAARAEYDGTTDTLTLTGAPEFRDTTLEMTANRFEVQRAAGKMLASGAVETTLRSNSQTQTSPGPLLSGDQPTHIIAREAVLLHDTQRAIFTGQARLWQGDNIIEAPVIEVSQKMQTLSAYGSGTCAQCVHSTFLAQSAEPSQQGTEKASKANRPGNHSPDSLGPSTTRVLSQRLLYSDAERKASFDNHVEVINSDGEVFADHAEVFLTPAAMRSSSKGVATPTEKEQKASSQRNNVSQSSVERIVATGHVVVVQPGRRGTGSRLVYTASDGHFVLTGDGGNPPKVEDASQGSVTGQALTFAAQTQAIIVSGTANDSTTTKTRVQKK